MFEHAANVNTQSVCCGVSGFNTHQISESLPLVLHISQILMILFA